MLFHRLPHCSVLRSRVIVYTDVMAKFNLRAIKCTILYPTGTVAFSYSPTSPLPRFLSPSSNLMDIRWTSDRQQIDIRWTSDGQQMDIKWAILYLTGTLAFSFSLLFLFRLICPYDVHQGLPSWWTSYGHQIDTRWNQMDNRWTTDGHQMNIRWTTDGHKTVIVLSIH